MVLEEIRSQEDADAHDADAQQQFHALVFPAKNGARVIKHLSAKYGSLVDLGFPHLKRMKKHDEKPGNLIALIVPVAADGSHSFDEEDAASLTDQFNGTLCVVQVLKRGPKTREACELHTKRWPLIFHASLAPETQVEPITPAEIDAMTLRLQQAVSIGAALQRECDGKLEYCCATGCVIAVPTGENTYAAVADSTTNYFDEQYTFRQIFHPVMIAIDSVARRDRERDSANDHPKKHRRLDLDTSIAEQNTDTQAAEETTVVESYLCTGYDVFVDVEPCVMCAMALVHSRARRVIFAHRNASDGALASVHRLHTIKSLNHHYRAFHLQL